MFRKFDIRIPFLLALNLLYVYIISTVNSELAPYVCPVSYTHLRAHET